LAFILCLALLWGCCLPAHADVAALDTALSRWLDGETPVDFSASMQIVTLMPFDETTIAMLNGVLRHVTVDASISLSGEDGATDARIAVDGGAVMDWTENRQGDAYTFTTSLLPNRVLTSAEQSPMDVLTGAGNAGAEETEETATADDGLNNSDVADAFDFLSAVTQLQACYQALTDGIKDFATEKRASYNIKGIGAGKWSRIARLTVEQSEGLLSELRAVLSCGMDDLYRAEIAQMTFEKGFIVALYQNSDGQDICVYLKGNVGYPDGTRRKLLFQWAFTSDGLTRKDTYKYEVSKLSGTRDTRTVAASGSQVLKSGEFGIDCEAKTTLKRARLTDVCTRTVAMSGEKNASGVLTCKGEINREVAQTVSSDTVKTARNATVDLLLSPDGDGNRLSGTVTSQNTKDKTVLSELTWTFAAGAESAPAEETGGADTAPEADGVTVSLLPSDTATPAPETTNPPVSSLEQIAEGAAFHAAAGMGTESSPYLVGSAPTGLTAYEAPETETTVDLDGLSEAALQNLLSEATQNLAGRLIVAVAGLPAEDIALLSDGMTDTDYAAFLALLEAL